jgi:hypothetical protein
MKTQMRTRFAFGLMFMMMLALAMGALMHAAQPVAAQTTGRRALVAPIIPEIEFDTWVYGTTTSTQRQNQYTFEGVAGQYVTIRMEQARGSSIDPWLELRDPGGRLVAYDDDSAGSPNSLIRNCRLQRSGTYTVVAGSYQDLSYGGYWIYVTIYR